MIESPAISGRLNATTIEFVEAPDYTFRIMRETELDDLAVFYPGSSIKSEDLNDNFEQLKFAIEEGWCRVSTEFYCYLEEYIWDCTDTFFRKDQIAGNAVPSDQKITSFAAQAARYDTYLQDGKPEELEYEQGGKAV